MAHSLKCQVCSKPATVHLTQIVNNKIHKVDLCEACAQAKGVTDPSGFSLADLLVASTATEGASDAFTCEVCNFTQAHFKKIGRLGCPSCWTRFREQIDPLLGTMHRGIRHSGKAPARSLARRQVRDTLHRLKSDLQQAISSERYEDAARFRDEIAQVQSQLSPTDET